MENEEHAAGVLSTREVTGRGDRRPRPIPDLQGFSSLRREYFLMIGRFQDESEIVFGKNSILWGFSPSGFRGVESGRVRK